MNIYGKITLLAAGVALVSSAATLTAVNIFGIHTNDITVPTTSLQHDENVTLAAMNGFVNVSDRPGVDTDFTYAAEKSVGGVVSIKSFASPRRGNGYSGGTPFSDPFFEYFFGPQQSQPRHRNRGGDSGNGEEAQREMGLGSGVILTSDGYIVTNNHVINGAERLEVTLNDNRSFNATVIGADPTTDIALIKIDATDLPVIPMGNSDNLKVGEWVLAVGNPFGFNSTVTTGIVSAKARSISEASHSNQGRMGLDSFIQTDAAVNPGNSGGALVNLAGELVGINTAIYSQTGNYAGYSFAVPTTIVNKIVNDLKEFGAVQRAVLGIRYGALTPKLAKEEGITAVTEGLYVGEVIERGAAMEAGIEEGDVIIAINGKPTRNSAEMGEQINKYRPGDKITVTFIRDNKEKTVNVTLRNNQGSTSITKASSLTDLGCAFKSVDERTLRQLGLRSGVQVAGLKDGKLRASGMKDGFIIISINGMRVRTADDIEAIYKAALEDSEEKALFITGLYPTGKKAYYAVDLSE